MVTARYISNYTGNSIDDIKIASLYFDKIEVVNDTLYKVKPEKGNRLMKAGDIGIITDVIEFVTEEFKNRISMLEDEGIVSIIENESREDKLWERIQEQAYRLINDATEILFQQFDNEYKQKGQMKVRLSQEVVDVHKLFIGPLEINNVIDLNFILRYYSSLIKSLLGSMALGKQCITSSKALNSFIKYYYTNGDIIKIQNELDDHKLECNAPFAYEAVKFFVPDISRFSFDDILEFRYRLNDELCEFREYMGILQFDLLKDYETEYINSHSKEFVMTKINPSIKQLMQKISSTKINVSQKILDELKSPLAYTPFIGTLFNKIPIHIASLLSFGLIGTNTVLNYIKDNKEIKSNGLYYLIELKKNFS